MSKTKTSTTTNAFTPDIVFYTKRNGHQDSCFDRYPDWFSKWLGDNKDNIYFSCDDHDNIADMRLYNGEELLHKFRLGDCVALTSQGVKINFAAFYEVLKDIGITNNSVTSTQVTQEDSIV